ncbi:MAG TPA: hypothetical protein DER60_02905 [Syntrophomonas sp.]|jgi:hypothetical protein|nr:hypothetical protein [Syntrophomonas sp.]
MKTRYQRDSYRRDNRREEDYDYSPYPKKDYYEEQDNYCPFPKKDDNQDFKKDKDKNKPDFETETILKCGTSVGSGPISCNGILVNGAASSGINNSSYGVVQATVSLDTSDLIDPTVKLDFFSLISFRTTDDDNFLLRLVFKLSRVCCGSHVPLGTWTFERQSNEDFVTNQNENEFVQQSDSFAFSFCACETCPECCHYVVELVSQECFNIAFATVTNISLSALAVGKKRKK